jgi:UDP-N-acetylmuramate dehydrogenase
MRPPETKIPPHWRRDVPLAPLTAWKVGGPARFLSEPADPSALAHDLRIAGDLGLPVFLLGGGSNLLVADEGFPGLVLRYRDRALRLEVSRENPQAAHLRVAAGAPLAGTARAMAYKGWAGLEWAEGIPGTIGGAVAGNAGAYGGEIARVLEEAEVLVGASRREVWPAEAFRFGYRTSRIRELPSGQAVILSATFRLHREDPTGLRERMERFARRRRATTPTGQTCGSVFRNPPGDAAGRLIEAAGLKGHAVGGARVAREHANYILNEGTATAQDILELIRHVRDEVLRRFQVRLVPEVQFVGFPDDVLADLSGAARDE